MSYEIRGIIRGLVVESDGMRHHAVLVDRRYDWVHIGYYPWCSFDVDSQNLGTTAQLRGCDLPGMPYVAAPGAPSCVECLGRSKERWMPFDERLIKELSP